MSSTAELSWRVWALLAAGPVLFLIAIVAVSIYFTSSGVAPDEVPATVQRYVPQILLSVLASLGLFLTVIARRQTRGAWRVEIDGSLMHNVGIGVAIGVAIALLYLFALAPLVTYLQKNVGDYVAPGSILPTLSRSIGVFFLANVILAPLVEETLYRGVCFPALEARFGVAAAIAVTCLAFAALHWVGGLWYMLVTGLVAGGAFAGLYVWRGGLAAPFAAHLALNVVEFLYAWNRTRG